MKISQMIDSLEKCPIIASVHDDDFESALNYPGDIIIYTKANIMTIEEKIKAVHNAGKKILIHIDLAEGIGKDKNGIEFLARLGADGFVSTKYQLIRFARELNAITVQRFFALDTQGLCSIKEMLYNSKPDFMEIMPGIINKVVEEFSGGSIPVIASGLIETKAEVMDALSSGAIAVSTRKQALWYI